MPKFLILRFSSIGDIVLTTPVIRCIKQQVKNAEVHYATKKTFSEIIEHNPYIDKKIFLEENLSGLIHELKKEKYDYIIDLHHNLRTWLIKSRLGVKAFSFDKINFEKWLIVNFKINRLPRVHVVDRYMETVKSFNVTNDGLGLDYFITEQDEHVLKMLPASHQNGFIGFVIGANHTTKKLPNEKIISICKKLTQPVILLGGTEDFQNGEDIEKTVSASIGGHPIFNAAGKYRINESAALVKHASHIITHDTGLMHIAAAFKKEITSVWGNTIPEFGMSPYYGAMNKGNRTLVELKSLSCRPCSKLGYDHCPKKHFKCMTELDENKIVVSLQD
ncbi:MAG: glycosyltransferase family 9 protein [Bacteroidetes bacterium]|nr:glycosyltransferase family 9 protein [Bacteroidota bacterium]